MAALEENLAELRRHSAVISDLAAVVALLEWDQEVNMPRKGAQARAEQLATVAGILHTHRTDPHFGELLRETCARCAELDEDTAAWVREALYDFERASCLPTPFVERWSAAVSAAFMGWTQAKAESRFSLFLPHVEELVQLAREKADYYGYTESPYDALLEDYERGMTSAALRALFPSLAQRLSDLVRNLLATGKTPPNLPPGPWDEHAQWALTLEVLRDVGYDFDAGRQDRSPHPFTCNFDIHDVRITTRLHPESPIPALMSSLHECGHALYEQGFLESDRRTPMAQAPSLGIHESQSRLWENLVGRSLPFCEYLLPRLQKHFPKETQGITVPLLYGALNRVTPSLIRTEADECTYTLHIVFRFEIEVDLLEKRLAPRDIPECWNAKVKQYLDLAVPDDAHGCLQDIHWAHGAFGYFPSYALGNLYAAQLWETLIRDVGDVPAAVRDGNFRPILTWLREHVHRVGRRYTTPELIRRVTGQNADTDAFLRYLRNKYTALYAAV